MKETYTEAMAEVYKDEGGYSNDAGDPGGPTNWGITIADARMYWKANATSEDVRNMPKSVAEDIYRKHYATPLHYDELPPGVDYAVLDYGINSGISRSAKVLQGIAGVVQDGKIGPATIAKVKTLDPESTINAIYDERLKFLRGLSTFSLFGRGWADRVTRGRAIALSLARKYKDYKPNAGTTTTVAVVTTGVVAATQAPNHMVMWVVLGSIAAAFVLGYIVYRIRNRKTNNVVVA